MNNGEAGINTSDRVIIDANPKQVERGKEILVIWTTIGEPRNCTATGSWKGSKFANGREYIIPQTDSTYVLSCIYPDGKNETSVASIKIIEPVYRSRTVLDNLAPLFLGIMIALIVYVLIKKVYKNEK